MSENSAVAASKADTNSTRRSGLKHRASRLNLSGPNKQPQENAVKPMKKKHTKRHSVELHDETEVLLDRMQSQLKARSHTEVFQKAIQLLAYVLGEENEPRKQIYVSRGDGKLQEILIL